MESQYNLLLSKSKTVGDFFENVYAPTLQTLPWIEKEDGLKTASEKVLGNIAFPAYELSSYKNQKETPETIERLRARCNELESIYQQMQDELKPILEMLPAEERTWEKMREMLPQWKNLSSSDLLSKSMHEAVRKSFDPVEPVALSRSFGGREIAESHGPTAHDILAKLMAKKIQALHREGKSDHSIAVTFGSHGFWLDRGFLNTIRPLAGH